jgi:hypothetical protein
VLDVRHDQVRPIRTHSLDTDIQVLSADVYADRFNSSLVQPLGRPCVPAAAVKQHVTIPEIQQRHGRTKEPDEVKGEICVVRVEGRGYPGEKKWGSSTCWRCRFLRAYRAFRSVPEDSRRERGVQGGHERLREAGWRTRQVLPVAILIAEMVWQQL